MTDEQKAIKIIDKLKRLEAEIKQLKVELRELHEKKNYTYGTDALRGDQLPS